MQGRRADQFTMEVIIHGTKTGAVGSASAVFDTEEIFQFRRSLILVKQIMNLEGPRKMALGCLLSLSLQYVFAVRSLGSLKSHAG